MGCCPSKLPDEPENLPSGLSSGGGAGSGLEPAKSDVQPLATRKTPPLAKSDSAAAPPSPGSTSAPPDPLVRPVATFKTSMGTFEAEIYLKERHENEIVSALLDKFRAFCDALEMTPRQPAPITSHDLHAAEEGGDASTFG